MACYFALGESLGVAVVSSSPFVVAISFRFPGAVIRESDTGTEDYTMSGMFNSVQNKETRPRISAFQFYSTDFVNRTLTSSASEP